MTPQEVARLFHEAYERLAPSFGYATRAESAVPWDAVPEPNKSLMVAVAGEVLAAMPQESGLRDCASCGAHTDLTHCNACYWRMIERGDAALAATPAPAEARLAEAERLLLEVYEQDMEYAPPKPNGGREGVLQRIHAFLAPPKEPKP